MQQEEEETCREHKPSALTEGTLIQVCSEIQAFHNSQKEELNTSKSPLRYHWPVSRGLRWELQNPLFHAPSCTVECAVQRGQTGLSATCVCLAVLSVFYSFSCFSRFSVCLSLFPSLFLCFVCVGVCPPCQKVSVTVPLDRTAPKKGVRRRNKEYAWRQFEGRPICRLLVQSVVTLDTALGSVATSLLRWPSYFLYNSNHIQPYQTAETRRPRLQDCVVITRDYTGRHCLPCQSFLEAVHLQHQYWLLHGDTCRCAADSARKNKWPQIRWLSCLIIVSSFGRIISGKFFSWLVFHLHVLTLGENVGVPFLNHLALLQIWNEAGEAFARNHQPLQ